MKKINLQILYLNVSKEENERFFYDMENILNKIFEYFRNKNFNFIKNLHNKNLELSLVITNDVEIAKINNKWRGINKPTNVLSMAMFDFNNESFSSFKNIALGDVVISLDTAKKESKEDNISLEDYIIKLFIHGVLHILGFDHNNDKEAEIMNNLEDELLKNFLVNTKGLVSNYWVEQ